MSVAAQRIAPAHFQIRDDTNVGAAWRRVLDALPTGWFLDVIVTELRVIVTAAPSMITGEEKLTARRATLLEAFDELLAALDARASGAQQ